MDAWHRSILCATLPYICTVNDLPCLEKITDSTKNLNTFPYSTYFFEKAPNSFTFQIDQSSDLLDMKLFHAMRSVALSLFTNCQDSPPEFKKILEDNIESLLL